MANISNSSDKWYFTKEQLENTASRKCGYDAHKELVYRQQAANFIQDMGQRLKVSQLCINTAIVYMHRFYVFHSFTLFPWYQMAAAALFLAAKVEEQPRKLEYVIRVANACRNPKDTNIDLNSEKYITQSQDLVFNENVLLQTLGFDVAIDHPHTHVVRCCHLVRASKDISQTSYFMASNSLHLTTMCLQYKPTVVACFCILVACKWSNWEIPLSNEKKEWFSYVDSTVTAELLQQLTEEFLAIFEACPSRLKGKIMAIAENIPHNPTPTTNSPFDDPKKIREVGKDQAHRSHESKSGMDNDAHRHRSRLHEAGSSSQQQRERDRNRERMSAQQKSMAGSQSKVPTHGHQRPPIDPKLKTNTRPHSIGGYPISNRAETRDILRESRESPFGLANKEYRDPVREHPKDVMRNESKDSQKRDYLLKSNVQTDLNSVNNYPDSRMYGADKQRIDPNKIRMDTNKMLPSKHDPNRRQEDLKPYIKSETENIKKHLSAGIPDKNAYINKSLTSTSKKVKSPPNVEISKSVPKQNISQPNALPKLQYNESSNGSLFSPPSFTNDVKPKVEHISTKLDISPKLETISPKIEESIKQDMSLPLVIKRPSLFSPEKTPPYRKAKSPRSSSSEPELRPVMKKIDQVEGFENIMRDSTIGINHAEQGADTVCPENASESGNAAPNNAVDTLNKTNGRASLVNGLETDPTIISNLLKEAPTVPHLPSVATVSESSSSNASGAPVQTQTEIKGGKDHHHHKSKKKNKEKHKHKDKNRDDKEKKKKHKDKDREKHKHKEKVEAPSVSSTAFPPTGPIKLKIQKDKIIIPETTANSSSQSVGNSSQGLKIKIPKDKIKTDGLTELSQAPVPSSLGIKLKIPKEKISNCNLPNLESAGNNSKKRERDRSSPSEAPPTKVPKLAVKDPKPNGRYMPHKVSNSSMPQNFVPPPNIPPPRPLYQPPPPPPPPQPPLIQPQPHPNSMYYQYAPMHPSTLPDMSIPPPPYMYPNYYHQGYMYPQGMYQQPPMPPINSSNPPLPMDLPPYVPPPPPPE